MPDTDLLQELHALLAMWDALATRERAKAATPGRADDMPAEWRYLYADAMETARDDLARVLVEVVSER